MVMLPEMCMNVYEISKGTIQAMKPDGPIVQEPGGVDPVHDETEVKSVTSIDGDDKLLDLKV